MVWIEQKVRVHLKDLLDIELDQITPRMCRDLHESLSRTSRKSSANGVARVLKAILNDAGRTTDLPRNPVSRGICMNKEVPAVLKITMDDLPQVWADAAARAGDYADGATSASAWLFQCLFAVTAVTIISGTLAERIRLGPFFVFVVIMSTLLYPIQGAWGWGGGWLSVRGFLDFAGGTHVHAAAGWAALTGAIVLGPRRGRFLRDGSVRTLPASSLPLATLGTMILWLGWLGFNGGSLGSMSSAADLLTISQVYVNTIMATCGGIVVAVLLTQATTGKVDLTMVLNGALAGLVSITAGPDTPGVAGSILIGATGTALMVATTHLLLKLRIDDVIGAVPVHLPCGLWGTVAVSFSNPDARLATQLLGAASISAFMIVASTIVWLGLRALMRLRLTQGEEAIGIDLVETGALAYPEFATRALASVD